MQKEFEQTQGQQLLKQLRDSYRKQETRDSQPEADNHASGSLPGPEYWPAEISRTIN